MSVILWIFKIDCCCLVPKSCPTLGNPMNCTPPDSFVHGISKAMEMVLLPSPGYIPNPRIEPATHACPALAGGFFTTELPGKA